MRKQNNINPWIEWLAGHGLELEETVQPKPETVKIDKKEPTEVKPPEPSVIEHEVEPTEKQDEEASE